MKRVDLIFNERELQSILDVLEKSNVPGYTVVKHATGRGPERVVTEDMEFTGCGSNVHLIIFCEESFIKKIREGVLSVLNYYGGVAYVSDASPL